MEFRMRWKWTKKWSFLLSFFHSIFVILSNSALMPNLSSDTTINNNPPLPHTSIPLPPPPQLHHHLPSQLLHPLPHLQELQVAANDPLQVQCKPKWQQPVIWALGYVCFLFISSFYKLTACNSLFLGSILLYPWCETLTQPMTTQQPHYPSQPHEQLLMEWIVGGMTTSTPNNDNEQPSIHPTSMSNWL